MNRRERERLKRLAREHFTFDLSISNYVPARGNSVYDAVYQGAAAKRALWCARVGNGFMNAKERRWYETYKECNPTEGRS